MGDWFGEWVGLYCEATGSNEKVRAVLLACRHEIAVQWATTAAELSECCSRLIAGGRVPQFAPGVTNALRAELDRLREERAAAARNTTGYTSPAPPACRWCRDTGLVTVPLWRCVEVPRDDPPRLVCYPGYRTVLTGSVLCDSPACEPGRRARDGEAKRERPRPTLATYLRRFGGVNVVAMLEDHERAVAAEARRLARPDDVTRHLFAGLLAKTLEARAA